MFRVPLPKIRALATASSLLLSVALGACSLLLPFDIDGLPCDDSDSCQQGYFCNSDLLCEKEPPDTPCRPACGPLTVCDKGSCKPTCSGRACSAGQICDEDTGSCVDHPFEGALGSACFVHNDCNQIGGNAFCLQPWGSPSESPAPGSCTRQCDPDSPNSCGDGLECITFPGDTEPRSLCVPPSLSPCESEGDCVASGLSCGVYSVLIQRNAPQKWAPVLACRSRIDTGDIGTTCNTPADCSTGLCLNKEGRSLCSTPCQHSDHCEEVDTISSPNCRDVLLSGEQRPSVRTRLCISGKKSTLLQSCDSDQNCNFDAPHCLVLPEYNDGAKRCTTPCELNSCPGASTCRVAVGGFEGKDWNNYCGAPGL